MGLKHHSSNSISLQAFRIAHNLHKYPQSTPYHNELIEINEIPFNLMKQDLYTVQGLNNVY